MTDKVNSSSGHHHRGYSPHTLCLAEANSGGQSAYPLAASRPLAARATICRAPECISPYTSAAHGLPCQHLHIHKGIFFRSLRSTMVSSGSGPFCHQTTHRQACRTHPGWLARLLYVAARFSVNNAEDPLSNEMTHNCGSVTLHQTALFPRASAGFPQKGRRQEPVRIGTPSTLRTA